MNKYSGKQCPLLNNVNRAFLSSRRVLGAQFSDHFHFRILKGLGRHLYGERSGWTLDRVIAFIYPIGYVWRLRPRVQGEMVLEKVDFRAWCDGECLRAPFALAEDPGMVSRTHMVVHNHLWLHFQGIWCPLPPSWGLHACGACMFTPPHTHTRANILTHKNFQSALKFSFILLYVEDPGIFSHLIHISLSF